MAAKLTPEEKLFAIIQGGAQGAKVVRWRLRALSMKQLVSRLRSAITHPRVDLPRINQALAVIIGLLIMAGVLNPVLLKPDVDRVMAKAMQQVEPMSIDLPLAGLKPLEAYQQLLHERNPFRLTEPASTTPGPQQPGTPQAKTLLSDLRLVGISWSETPVAMIEQLSQQRTYVVKSGDPLAPFTIKAVLQDRVILTLDSEELELF